jgi:Mannosyltransferase (PIG-V)
VAVTERPVTAADTLEGGTIRRQRELRPFWTLVGIRVAFWVGTAITLLWQRPNFAAVDRDLTLPSFQAYDAHTDLLFNTFSQWDAGWYLNIAENGYRGEQAAAFFPVYPALVHGLAWITRSELVAGVLISLVAAGIAAVLLTKIVRDLLGERIARDSILLLALYPAAFAFTSIYSDGLFLALATGAVLAAMRDWPLLAGVLGGFAVGTRLIGLALLPALLILLWPRVRSLTAFARLAPLALLPAAVGLFALYLEDRLGNWRAFIDAQSDFWLRHTATLGPIGGLWEAIEMGYRGAAQVLLHLPRAAEVGVEDEQGARNALHLLLLLAAIWLTWVAWRRLGPAFGAYSVAYLGVILSSPIDYFPLTSLPRFLLGDFPLFAALASVLVTRPTARQIVLCSFAAVGAVAAVGFSRHAWFA